MLVIQQASHVRNDGLQFLRAPVLLLLCPGVQNGRGGGNGGGGLLGKGSDSARAGWMTGWLPGMPIYKCAPMINQSKFGYFILIKSLLNVIIECGTRIRLNAFFKIDFAYHHHCSTSDRRACTKGGQRTRVTQPLSFLSISDTIIVGFLVPVVLWSL